MTYFRKDFTEKPETWLTISTVNDKLAKMFFFKILTILGSNLSVWSFWGSCVHNRPYGHQYIHLEVLPTYQQNIKTGAKKIKLHFSERKTLFFDEAY